jgi:hypothetical protein
MIDLWQTDLLRIAYSVSLHLKTYADSPVLDITAQTESSLIETVYRARS